MFALCTDIAGLNSLKLAAFFFKSYTLNSTAERLDLGLEVRMRTESIQPNKNVRTKGQKITYQNCWVKNSFSKVTLVSFFFVFLTSSENFFRTTDYKLERAYLALLPPVEKPNTETLSC